MRTVDTFGVGRATFDTTMRERDVTRASSFRHDWRRCDGVVGHGRVGRRLLRLVLSVMLAFLGFIRANTRLNCWEIPSVRIAQAMAIRRKERAA